MKVDFSTAIVGLIIGIPSFLLGWLGLRRANKVDKATAKQAVASAHDAGISQIIDGLNKLIDNLQEDNQVWRQSFDSVTARLSECAKEREDLQRRLNDFLSN